VKVHMPTDTESIKLLYLLLTHIGPPRKEVFMALKKFTKMIRETLAYTPSLCYTPNREHERQDLVWLTESKQSGARFIIRQDNSKMVEENRKMRHKS